MSVLIRGMRMPEGCIDCLFAERIPPGRTRCLITCRILAENYNAPSHNRLGFCPLVDLGSHGDLIDRDALIELFPDCFKSLQTSVLFVRTAIQTAPTIIEAEGAGNAKS